MPLPSFEHRKRQRIPPHHTKIIWASQLDASVATGTCGCHDAYVTRRVFCQNPNGLSHQAVFEMGNVWSDTYEFDPFDLKRSAGMGIRVFIPMLGMLGYDIGYGFDYTDYDELYRGTEPHGWEYHLIFGMPF